MGRIQYTPNGVLMFHHRLHLTRFNCQSDTPVTFDRLLYQPNCDWAWNNKERDWTYWPRPDADANVADVAGCAPHLDMHTLHTSCNITYRFPTSSPQDTPLVLKVWDTEPDSPDGSRAASGSQHCPRRSPDPFHHCRCRMAQICSKCSQPRTQSLQLFNNKQNRCCADSASTLVLHCGTCHLISTCHFDHASPFTTRLLKQPASAALLPRRGPAELHPAALAPPRGQSCTPASGGPPPC